MAEELKGPGIFEIRQFIKNKTVVEFYTVNDKFLKGQILWYDGESFHLQLENKQEITLLKTSVIYYLKGEEEKTKV
ncbi:MAG: hypothetical protein PHV68_06035 [Candidatus Gastranaerophilales bacterium]|nr:hypothetical protein [Candidatus Gastranaerophilales bacterium]